MSATRIERDCLGEMEIPEEHYYGIQTHRMVKVSGTAHLPVIFYPGMHRALAQIKKACARANAEIGAITPEIGKAIAQAADEVYAGKFDDQFPLDMWQGGGYTCVNMNVNEVIGNRANEILTGHKGQDTVHPNTHVNKAQSTNDTIPSATHLAIASELDKIIAGVEALQHSFEKKAVEFKDDVKVGRTCWQDALRMREETGCDGVAVGRAAQGNPWIFAQIRDAMAGRPIHKPENEEKLAVLTRHLHMLAQLKGEAVAVREMRRHIVCYVRGMRDAARLRVRVNAITEMDELEKTLAAYMLEGKVE